MDKFEPGNFYFNTVAGIRFGWESVLSSGEEIKRILGPRVLLISDPELSFIVEEHMSQIFSLLALHSVRVNMMQNSAVSFSICIDNDKYKVPLLITDLQKDFKVGYIALEESIKRTSLGIMGVSLHKPLHLTREGVDDDTFRHTYNATVGNGNFYLYNHFGSTVADNLISKIRYLAKACAVDFVILDHLHMALSALGDGHTNDERKLIDYTVSVLRTLVEETGIGLILVSHLRRSEGDKGFEDGKNVTMNALRGSASIGQLSDLSLIHI